MFIIHRVALLCQEIGNGKAKCFGLRNMLYQKIFDNTLSCLYSRFSDSFHIISPVFWESGKREVFSVSALLRHKRMFFDGRIFQNHVVYNMLSQEHRVGQKFQLLVPK